MAEFQSKFTGQEIENTIDKLRNWLAAGIDGTYPTVTISSVTYDVIWKVIPTPGTKCFGIGLDRSTGRPYEIYYDGSSYKATALDTNTDTKNTAGSTNSTSKLYLVGANTLAENPQTFANNQVYMADGTLYLTKTKDLSGVADNKPALIVGGTNTTAHIEIDADEIHAKASGTTVAPLYLNHDGGNTYLSGKKTYSDGNYLYSDNKKVSVEGHTHSFDTITNRGEAFLSWGGQNFSGTYGPIDAAMVPELGANRLAFMPAEAVTIEYSRDGGSTWTDYGPTDPQKADLFNGRGASFTIGKATSGAGNIATNKYQLRVNIYTGTGRVYTVLNKFVIYLSTSGTNNNWCTIRARKQSDYTANKDKWTTFADKISVSGWSGYNVINTSGITTYGNTSSSQYGHIQFIFGCDTGSTNNSYPGLQINKIFGFGGVGWNTPSTMAKTGHIYTYDSSQNVTFPKDVSATSFTENGKKLASKYAGISHTHNYAGSDSAGGPANSVRNALTFGKKTYDGSSAQEITLADLGGQAAGDYAILSNGKLDDSVIPAVAITDTYVVATEAAMLALDAQKGDIAIRSDLNKSFVLQVTPASTLANWKELLTPTDAVLSVNGKTGTVTLNLDDINDGSTRKLSGYVTGPSSSTANAVPRYADTTGKILKNSGVTISDANVLSAAQLAANIIETGTGDNNYFQTRKFRGEGNAATYYHAIDFGFANHDRVDFYEYGGLWNFWKNTDAAATTADSNLCLQIGDTYVKNKNNTFTWPTTSGTLALTSNIPAALKNPNALTFGSKTYDGSSPQTITASDLGAFTSENAYWANVKVSTTSNNSTTPIFASVSLSNNGTAKASFSYNSSTDCVELTWI